ncbi:zinc ribbon domain-containing protein [Haloarchaeobius amylolyticus]|uniref:Zinc ribbon domain-containing protein n=1 Tax=Haloarchaeobius amylolyticus TaxID=1198296 RepID=A0ABD6BGH3_9EURY
MSEGPLDLHCPECGEPVGQTATYCMHCWADLPTDSTTADYATERRSAASTDADSFATRGETDAFADDDSERLLDPDGLVDNTLTVLVGIAGGLAVGIVETLVLLILTESGWILLVGPAVWLGATGYLVRCRTVQEAIAKTCYAVALVLLSVPLIAFGPGVTVDGGAGGAFFGLLLLVAIPAAIAAAIGWVASRFVPTAPVDGAT